MLISHKHKYLFVQLPRTGSTTIGRELRQNYEATKVLGKHATYEEFLKIATPEEKDYFVFSCIRNPLDDVVSIYMKYRNDHRNWYTNPEKIKRIKPLARLVNQTMFKFAQNENKDFADYFLRFYWIPYNNWSELSHHKFDYLIHFENLQEDFSRVLSLIGIEQKRPLPEINKTSGRSRDFSTYYNTPETIRRARRVFGPFMKKWGYEFPSEWKDHEVSWLHQAEFDFYNIFRRFYWKHLK